MDSADKGWVAFHAENWRKAQAGIWSWWKCEPYTFKRRDGKLEKVDPKWHLLQSVNRVGEHGDAQYVAACGYKHTFSRIFIAKPRSVVRKPKLADLCINCSHGKL